MYLIADLIRSTTRSLEFGTKPDAPPIQPPSCTTTLAKGARFAAFNFDSYASRCAPLTSITALDPPRRLTSSPSCEVAYPLLAEWHALHGDAPSAAGKTSTRADTTKRTKRTKRSKPTKLGGTKRAT